MSQYSISAELNEVAAYFLVTKVHNDGTVSECPFRTKEDAEEFVYDMIAIDKHEDWSVSYE